MARERVSFLRRFPVPHFLSIGAWGVDISDTSIKYLELVESRGAVSLGTYGEEPLAAGIVKTGGHIEKPAELAAALKKIKEREGIEYVALSLPEEQAYLFEMQLPFMKESELRSSLELDLEEHIPVPPTEVVFDFAVTRYPATPKDPYQLAVGAFPKILVEAYLSTCTDADLSPLSFEIEAHALARALIDSQSADMQMVVDLGKTRSGIAIGDARGVYFSATLPLGGEAITQAIEKALGVPKDEAEKIKVELGISRSQKDKELFAALVPVLSAFKDELSRTVTYWKTHPGGDGKPRPPITKLLLSGGQANMPGLAEFLSSGLGFPVEGGTPWVNVPLTGGVPEMPYPVALRYATAIGLALRHIP